VDRDPSYSTTIPLAEIEASVTDGDPHPTAVVAHPVGTIMAIAERAGDILAARWS
jgi:hypothetical protein